MKILTLISKFPWPLTDGAVIRDFNLLREASRRHDVSLLCFLFKPSDREHYDALRPYCKKIVGIDLVQGGEGRAAYPGDADGAGGRRIEARDQPQRGRILAARNGAGTRKVR